MRPPSFLCFFQDASQVFRLVDHGAVFVLIAGTYTPFLLVNLAHTPLGPGLLLGVWITAAAGVVMTACRGCIRSGVSTNATEDPAVAASAEAGVASAPPGHASHVCGLRLPLRLLLYTLQGWCGAVAFILMRSCLSSEGWWSLFLGGLVYSVGLLLYSRDHTTHQLQYWYLLVVGASALHWVAVFLHVRPPSAECIAEAAARGLAWDGFSVQTTP